MLADNIVVGRIPYRQGLLPSVRVFIDHLAAEFPKAVLMQRFRQSSDRLGRAKVIAGKAAVLAASGETFETIEEQRAAKPAAA